jgi:N-acetylglucosaminyldiphosphoundecaprenol N-acetyl-beta-D-mannosaminyltransferase
MTVSVLDIPLFERGLESAVSETIESCLSEPDGVNKLVSATGAHGLVHAKRNKDFASILRSFYRNLPDGMPSVWIGNLKGAKGMERCYGPDFLRRVLEKSADKPIKHFFCGGKDGVAEELRILCEEKLNNRNCVGTFTPPFKDMAESEFVELGKMINTSQADIVWVGLSTPKQEIFAKRLSNYVRVHFIITVGAAFDFITGRVKQAPAFVQRIGMEWLFRLLMEPRRLYRRYLKIVPLFFIYAIIDLVGSNYKQGES